MGNRMTCPKNYLVLMCLLAVFLVCPALCSAGDLELFIGIDRGGQCVKSFDGTLTVRQQPTPFCVALSNRSSSSQSVYWQVESGAITSLSFELTDEKGKKTIVKRKKVSVRSTQVVSDYLAAGKSIDKTILVDPDEWENVPVIAPGTVQTFKARAVFDNNNSKIYSPYYTLVFDGQ